MNLLYISQCGLTFTQVLQGQAGTPTAAEHRLEMLQCQRYPPVCTAVQGVGLPAGKLTMWSIICDKGLLGEA